MKAAIVGAGFAGLAVAYQLISMGISVDLIEEKEIGAGASGVASGLLHPYPGEQVRRSRFAEESLSEAKLLLDFAGGFSDSPIADFSGIVRKANPEQIQTFLSHAKTYGDIDVLDESTFLIKSGITVYSKKYLEALFAGLESKGVRLKKEKISSFDELAEYALFFLTIGAGILNFKGLEHLPVKGIKGQALTCEGSRDLPLRSLIGKGYFVPLENGDFHMGATYEREKADETPDLETALRILTPKAQDLIPGFESLEVKECKAGVRVAKSGDYFPHIEKISEKGFVLTGMGSRGLFYHGYASKLLVKLAFS